MKNSWNKVVALMLATALCVSCGVTGFAEDTQTNENTEIVEVVEQQTQEEPPKEEAPAPEPVKEPEPAPVQEEPKAEPAPAPKEEPKAEPVKEEPKVEAPKAEEPKAEEPKKEEPKQEEETKADEKTEVKIEEKAEEPEQKVEESAEQKKEDVKADETKKDEETKAETKDEEPKAEESNTEESQTEETKPEEKPVEQPTVPAAAKVEQPVEDLSAADEVKKENITVHIEWADEDNALGLRPQTLAVTLNGSDGQTYSATIAEKDGWQHTFADLTTQRGAEVIYYSVDADDAADYDKDVRGLTVTYTCTAKPAAEDESLIDDQMDDEQGELPEGDGPTVTETEDGTVIDMGETAKEPVEGEEANAEKPAEDGELDEDFTLPEEGELPEEDAEPEIPEIPEIDFSTLSVAISAESDVVELGGDMVLTAVLTGFEDLNYTLQWQFSADNANWADVDGATGSTLRVQMNEENRDYFWRVSVDNISWKNPPVVQTEPTLDVADTAETGAQE